MRIIGCDLHAASRRLRCWIATPGRSVEQTLKHDGETVREFYRGLPHAGRGRASKRRGRWAGSCG